jgi:DUF1365 family protein
MDLDYELTYGAPDEQLMVSFRVLRGEEPVLFAGTSLRQSVLDASGIRSLLLSYPAMTFRVSTAIYRQAVKLTRMGAPFFVHLKRSRQRELVDHISR